MRYKCILFYESKLTFYFVIQKSKFFLYTKIITHHSFSFIFIYLVISFTLFQSFWADFLLLLPKASFACVSLFFLLLLSFFLLP